VPAKSRCCREIAYLPERPAALLRPFALAITFVGRRDVYRVSTEQDLVNTCNGYGTRLQIFGEDEDRGRDAYHYAPPTPYEQAIARAFLRGKELLEDADERSLPMRGARVGLRIEAEGAAS
jgi:hypothetical protein